MLGRMPPWAMVTLPRKVRADGQLQVARNEACPLGLTVVLGDVACQHQDLSCQVDSELAPTSRQSYPCAAGGVPGSRKLQPGAGGERLGRGSGLASLLAMARHSYKKEIEKKMFKGI